MKPIDQTRLHDPANGVFGNCFNAVVASLLHLPIEAVPELSNDTWIEDINRWLRRYGLCYADLLGNVGIDGLYSELHGPSPRNSDVLHAVVGLDGQIVHDPHPDRSGLQSVDGCGVFILTKPWLIVDMNKELDIVHSCATDVYNLADRHGCTEIIDRIKLMMDECAPFRNDLPIKQDPSTTEASPSDLHATYSAPSVEPAIEQILMGPEEMAKLKEAYKTLRTALEHLVDASDAEELKNMAENLEKFQDYPNAMVALEAIRTLLSTMDVPA